MSRGRRHGGYHGGWHPPDRSILEEIIIVVTGTASLVFEFFTRPRSSTTSIQPSPTRSFNVTFVISDTHFGHKNIRAYAGRPYRSTHAMNKSMVIKWNQSILPQDTVYFLGDFAWNHIGRYITRLQGHKVFIRGNHDNRLRGTRKSAVVSFEDYTFLLIHNPAWITEWNGWVIHGHVHDKRPFIDISEKRINVSVEVIGYRPISLHRIVQTIHAMNKLGLKVAKDRKHAGEIRRMADAQIPTC